MFGALAQALDELRGRNRTSRQQAGALAEDEDVVSLVDGVAQEGRAAGEAQVPEGAGDDAGFPPLRRDPLDEEATGEEELSE